MFLMLRYKFLQLIKHKWRKRVGVEPTDDGSARHPPVLKTGTITGPHALPFFSLAAN